MVDIFNFDGANTKGIGWLTKGIGRDDLVFYPGYRDYPDYPGSDRLFGA